MKNSTVAILATFALGLGATTVHAADSFLFQWDDTGTTLYGDTYQNGTLIQHAPVGPESYGGGYGIWNGSTVLSDFSVAFNILDASGALSDVWSISGTAGSHSFNTPFVSGGFNALPAGATIFETGNYQTVYTFTVANGDDYTLQFRSDADVPEPAAWTMMIAGFGLLGLTARRRRTSTLSA